MAFYQVAVGGKVLAADLNQIIQTFTGIAANPVLMDGDTGGSYWFTIFQRNTANGLIMLIKNSAGNLLKVTKDGVRLSVDGALFDKIPVTTDGVQALSNKTLDGTNAYSALPGASIVALSIPTAAYADLSITNAKIADATIEGKKLGPQEAALVYKSADVSVVQNAIATVSWDSEEYDAGLHSAADNTKFTAITSGLFETGGTIVMDGSTFSADIKVELWKNGSLIRRPGGGNYSGQGSTDVVVPWQTSLRLNAGDYIQVKMQHWDGGSRNMLGGATRSHWWIRKVGS